MVTKVIFMGTPIFAKEVLLKLLTMDFIEVVAVVCQPDRKVGRKQEMRIGAVKQVALASKLKIFQPDNINDIVLELDNLNADLIITCAYGQFFGTRILQLVPKGCLNIHASLLPKLRGGAPIHWAVINDEKETGISLMKMTSQMDAGPVFVQEKIRLVANETASSLHYRLILLANMMLEKYLFLIISGKITPEIQNERLVSFGLNIKRNNEKIIWNVDARKVTCQIRGLFEIPLAYTTYENKIYKIHQAIVYDINKQEKVAGTILSFQQDGIEVQTSKGSVLIQRLQPEGKKAILVKNFYQGQHPLRVGTKFI